MRIRRRKEPEEGFLPEAHGREVIILLVLAVLALGGLLIWPAIVTGIVITVLVWFAHYPVASEAVIGIPVIAGLVFLAIRHGRISRGQPESRVARVIVIWRGTSRIWWRQCRYCTGSLQWLHPDRGFGKIPYEIRLTRRDEVGWRLANTRNCPHCRGAGSTWQAEDTEEEAS